jgi:hypothetical protein
MKHLSGLVSIVLILSAAGSRSLGQRAADAPRESDVFVAGEGGYHTYRIPSVIVTPSGTLLAFAEGRQGSAADSGNIDLVLRRSVDGGASWSPMQVLVDNGQDSASNPCPVVDRATGTIWLISTRNRGTDREADIVAGRSHATPTVWVMNSRDDGVTWSTPVEITASVKAPGWTWYATGPGAGIQTERGRLVIPANHAELPGGLHRSHLFYSDDGGKTWTLGGSADPGTNESQVVELSDGRLMLNMRNHPPKSANYRMVATSADGGRTLSSARADQALIEPPAQASILRYSNAGAGDRDRLLFSNPASAKREKLTVRLSYDEGLTWPVARVVHDGPAAYSMLAILPDRSIGILFERGDKSPYEKVTFERFSLAWLTAGQDPSGVAPAAPPIGRSGVAERVMLLTRESRWNALAALPVRFVTHHPQGMVRIGETFYVSAVEVTVPGRRYARPVDGYDRDPGEGIGHLFKIDSGGQLLTDLTLGEKTVYHPGGIDFDGTSIWVPVAEYRPDSHSIIYRVDPATMKAVEVFRAADHIGGIVHDTDDNTLHGVSWGSRRFFRWKLDRRGRVTNAGAAPQALGQPNPSHYVDYQDCKYAADHRMLCTGVAEYRQSPAARPFRLGGMDLIDLRDGRPLHQVPVPLWTDNGLDMTHNPVWIEPDGEGLRAYFMPEDDRSTIYVYRVK